MQGARSTLSIVMRGAELFVRIGEHPWEKEKASRLKLDLILHFAFADYFGKHGGYVNYDPVRDFLKSLEEKPHVDRLEDLARTIIIACFAMTPAARIELRVMKPDIFAEMDAVGLHFDVRREDFA